MASFNIRASMFPFARCSWFCLLDPSFPLFSCDLASFRKGAQLSPLKVRVRSLPPRDVLTVIASHYCLLRYLSVPSLLGTYFSAVLASVREKKNLRPLVHPHTIGFSDDFECHFPLT